LIVKTVFKSHFKMRSILKKKFEKKIFIKNMVIFILLSRSFFKNCEVNLLFLKRNRLSSNLLKAPSRHKKFFHQIKIETFFIKIFFKFKCVELKEIYNLDSNILNLIRDVDLIFSKIGSNTLNRLKITTIIHRKHRFDLF
jgi:hypothetical protein